MPSKKPQFVIRADREVFDKISYIAKENERSATQEIEYMIKQKIAAYEAMYGEIKIEEKESNDEKQS